LVNFCIKEGINGFENLIDIPGSVGASPIQNIGAYGADVSELIDSVDCFCLGTFTKKNLTNKECSFAYRNSAIKNSQYLIYNINFKTNLNKNISYKYSSIQKYIESNSINPINLTTKDISKIISTIRSNVLPNPQFINNAGSFFKNPIIDKKLINFDNFTDDQLVIWNYSDTLVKVGAARLIQLIQDKIKPSQNVSIYKNHSLVLITNGKATQDDVLSFAAQINQLVYKTFNISLDIEPNIIN
jgi:UDP-N-acetylmuramate dehydrogenase